MSIAPELLPDSLSLGQLAARVPYEKLATIRAFHATNDEPALFAALDGVGVHAVATMVSEGILMPMVAKVFDVPLYMVKRWIEADSSRREIMADAFAAAAEVYASLAVKLYSDSSQTFDRSDIQRIKNQSDQLMKMAKAYGRERFGDQVSHTDKSGGGFQFNITLQAPATSEPKQVGEVFDASVLS